MKRKRTEAEPMEEIEEEYGSRNPYKRKDLQRLREQYKPGQKITVVLRKKQESRTVTAGKEGKSIRSWKYISIT